MPQPWRTVRVFISSTFRDMHAERDHLVRIVFPELKERCRRRHVQLIDVDLRWGVTQEQAEGGGSLDICLDEIDSCRPYFIGLIGHRYGYIPPGQKHSITAQEVYHGVLHNNLPRQLIDLRPFVEGILEGRTLLKEQISCLTRCYQWNADKRKYLLRDDITPEDTNILRMIFDAYSIYQKDRSFFFFRSESLTTKLAGANVEDFFEADDKTKDMLATLKQDIVNAGLPHFEYDDVEAFGQMVLDTLWNRVDAEFPEKREEKERDWLKDEAELHDLFMADRTRRFVGRSDILKGMHSSVEKDDDHRLLVVTGEPGCGKSALMARFTEEAIHRHPDWLVLAHFIGASPASSSIRLTLRNLCTHINRSLGVTDDVPEDYKELVNLFPQLLQKISGTRRVLLVIDALNQFDKADNAHWMNWMPQSLPQNVKVVVSTLAGEVMDALLARRPRPVIVKVEGLKPDEIKQLVTDYLGEIHHELPSSAIRDAFYEKIKAGHPLYIIVALEELKIFPKFEELEERIKTLPESVPELFAQVLKRIEGDLGQPVVRDFMCYLACGRQGMTAEELQYLLKEHAPVIDPDNPPDKFPDMLFARLRRAFSAYLFERSGVIDFFHGQLKEAVGARYLRDEGERDKVHHVIAGYFEQRWREPYLRALEELPHQLTKAKTWDGLERVLCDLLFIEAKCTAGMTYSLVGDYVMAIHADYPHTINQSDVMDFHRFVQAGSHILAVYPSLTFQLAANQPEGSVAASFAQRREQNGQESRPWLSWVNKPRIRSKCLMNLVGHSDYVHACAYSPDATSIVSASSDRTLRLWDAKTGALLAALAGHQGVVWACAFSPNGTLIVSASGDCTVRIWDRKTGINVLTIKGHSHGVRTCTFSPNGTQILSGSDDGCLKIWDALTGKELATLSEHDTYIEYSGFTPSGENIVSRDLNGVVKVWDIAQRKVIHTISSKLGNLLRCALSPDSHLFLWNYLDNSPLGLEVWDASACTLVRAMPSHGMENSCAFSPDGATFLSSRFGQVFLVDASSGAVLAVLGGHRETVNGLAFSPDGVHAASTSDDETVKVWDVSEMKRTKMSKEYCSGIESCAFSANGSKIVSGGYSQIKVWEARTGVRLAEMEDNCGYIRSCCFSPDGHRIISTSYRKVNVWESECGNLLGWLEGHDDEVNGCVFSPDGRQILTSSSDRTLKLWNADTYAQEQSIPFKKSKGGFALFSPNGRHILTHSEFGWLSLLDVSTGKEKMLFARDSAGNEIGTDGAVCAFSPDGHRISAVGEDECLVVLEVATGDQILRIGNPDERVTAIDFSPDSSYLAFGTEVGRLRIWDVRELVEVCLYLAEYGIGALAWSPSGRALAVGYTDGGLHILELRNVVLYPPIRPVWRRSIDNSMAFGCPLCHTWSQIPESASGTELACPNCGKMIKLNSFTIEADWQPIAKAWQVEKEN